MKTVCELNKCVGCHARKDLCPKDAIQIVDNVDCLNATINEEKCIKKFNFLVMRCCTKKWFRQFIKRQLIRTKIVGGNV